MQVEFFAILHFGPYGVLSFKFLHAIQALVSSVGLGAPGGLNLSSASYHQFIHLFRHEVSDLS